MNAAAFRHAPAPCVIALVVLFCAALTLLAAPERAPAAIWMDPRTITGDPELDQYSEIGGTLSLGDGVYLAGPGSVKLLSYTTNKIVTVKPGTPAIYLADITWPAPMKRVAIGDPFKTGNWYYAEAPQLKELLLSDMRAMGWVTGVAWSVKKFNASSSVTTSTIPAGAQINPLGCFVYRNGDTRPTVRYREYFRVTAGWQSSTGAGLATGFIDMTGEEGPCGYGRKVYP